MREDIREWSRKLPVPKWLTVCFAALWHLQLTYAQTADVLEPQVRKYVRVSTPKVVLEHVRIIDGREHRRSPIKRSRSKTARSLQSGRKRTTYRVPTSPSSTCVAIRLSGHRRNHGHLSFYARPNLQADGSYESPSLVTQMSFSAPRLFLANGVTTMRGAGSVEPQTEVNLKQAIEKGVAPGPHLYITGPFLGGPGLHTPVLTGAEDARETVAFWADRGVTSFKAYVNITHAELQAVVTEAHKRGLKVLGYLCSVTYEEAAEIGIDSLEHGFFVNTQLDPGKQPDKCSESRGDYTLEHMYAEQANNLITTLIEHHVAITSTLPSTAWNVPSLNPGVDRPLKPAALAAMSPDARDGYFIDLKRARRSGGPDTTNLLRRDMQLERAFVAAGGLLMAESDPVGLFGSVPGYADHREIELLVEAGFTPWRRSRSRL